MLQLLAKLFSTFSLGLAASIVALSSTSTPLSLTGPVLLAQISPTSIISDETNTVSTSTPEEISASLHYKITQLRNQIEKDNILKLISLDHPPILGEKSASVEKIQELLSNLELLKNDSVTGYFGPTTTKAIQYFQTYYILPATGTLDSQTLNQIVGVAIARENLASIYFPEENNLLDVATSSQAEASSLTNTLNYLTPGDSSYTPDPQVVTVYDCTTSIGNTQVASVTLTPATQTMISQGNPAVLTWNAKNANSCAAVSPASWTTSTAISGSQAVSPTTVSTTTLTYSIKCISSVGGASPTVSATITVYPKHP